MTEAFESQTEADLVDRIRTGSEYRPDMAPVAVEADQIVGHVMIDGCWVPASTVIARSSCSRRSPYCHPISSTALVRR